MKMNFTKTIGLAALMMAAAILPAIGVVDAYPEQENQHTHTSHDGDFSSVINNVDYQLWDSDHWGNHCDVKTGHDCDVNK